MRKYIVEFIGTFFLVLTICMTVLGGLGNLAPIAIGSILMVMVYAGGHISGAHYNPAVTLAVFMRGKCSQEEVPGYILAQLVAAFAAPMVANMLLGGLGNTAPIHDVGPALVGEFLGTFALAYVVLNVATAKGTDGNSFYGVAIGFTVAACAYALGGLSGGAFNPAVAVGTSIANMASWSQLWVYLLAQLAAGAAAATAFNYVNSGE